MAYSIDSNLGSLLDDEHTNAILEQHMPGISKHPSIGMGRAMSLRAVADFSGGLIKPEMLDKVAADLAKLA